MRTKKMLMTGAVASAISLSMVGCSGITESDSDKVASTSQLQTQSPSETTTSKKPSPTQSSETEAKPQALSRDTGIVDVPEADYTPADGPNARIFQLQDGATKCFLNNLGGDAYLACQTPIANPPMVDDGAGNQVPANAVSWNPGGVTYEVLTFPQASEIHTLAKNQRLKAFGFTCTALGPSSVECSGGPGTARIDSGVVTGAQMPKPPVTGGQQPGPGQAPAPAPAPEPGQGLPKLQDLIPGIPG